MKNLLYYHQLRKYFLLFHTGRLAEENHFVKVYRNFSLTFFLWAEKQKYLY